MTERPQIEPLLLAAILEAAPGRVRSRLDKQPAIAETWNWTRTADGFQVQAGDETVQLASSDGVLRELSQVHCSCLLSPKCFHVLACASVLPMAEPAAPADTPDTGGSVAPASRAGEVAPASQAGQPAIQPLANISPPIQQAAVRLREAVAGLLCVGARSCGALLQSGLLRAGHECRAAGLVALGNTALRLVEEVRRVRAQSDLSDSVALRQDLFLALHACELLIAGRQPPHWASGTSRRTYRPVAISRLAGWFAEPVLTRSGYAGLAVHLLAPDGRGFAVVQTRPGDAQLVWQAYQGGIDVGSIAPAGSELCRSQVVLQDATAAADGRLRTGGGTRWVLHGTSSWSDGAAAQRFRRPLDEQLQAVFQAAAGPADSRPAGWDLVCVRARILGAQGAALLAAIDGLPQPWRLRIAVDDPALAYRENLQLLARCPGLPLMAVVRVRLEAAGDAALLAIGPWEDGLTEAAAETAAPADTAPATEAAADETMPRLRLPDSWRGICNLGLDRLQRHHIDRVARWGVEVTLDEDTAGAAIDDGLSELRRRLASAALGGHRAVPAIDSSAHRRDVAALRRRNFSAAAELIEALAVARNARLGAGTFSGSGRPLSAPPFDRAWLAAALYLQTASLEFHRQAWHKSAAADQDV